MTDTDDTETNLANTIRGLKKFDGSNPADFKACMKKFCVVIGVTRRDILPLLKGEEKPTDTTKIADYNRVNEDLYAILYLLVELPAALCIQKYEGESEISGDGQAAFKELCGNYDKVTDEVIRATMDELVNTPMEHGQNPDDYFNKKRFLHIRIEKMGEKASDRWFKDICVTGFTDEYKNVKMMMYRDSSFDIDQMKTTMRRILFYQQSRNGTNGRIAGRGIAMTTKISTDHDVSASSARRAGTPRGTAPNISPGPSQTKQRSGARSTGLPRTTTKSATAKEHGRTRRRASLLRARAARTTLRETTSPPPTRQPPPRTTNHQTARSPSSTSPEATTTSTAASRSQQQPRDDSPSAPRAQRYWSTVVRRNHSSTTNGSQG